MVVYRDIHQRVVAVGMISKICHSMIRKVVVKKRRVNARLEVAHLEVAHLEVARLEVAKLGVDVSNKYITIDI